MYHLIFNFKSIIDLIYGRRKEDCNVKFLSARLFIMLRHVKTFSASAFVRLPYVVNPFFYFYVFVLFCFVFLFDRQALNHFTVSLNERSGIDVGALSLVVGHDLRKSKGGTGGVV